MKICVSCRAMKPLGEFTSDHRRRDGLHCYCRACHHAKQRLYAGRRNDPEYLAMKRERERFCSRCGDEKSPEEFYTRPDRPTAASYCSDCARAGNRAAMKRLHAKDPTIPRDRLRARRADPVVGPSDLERRRQRYAERPDVRVQAKMARDRYRKTRAQATPKWVDMAAIRAIYEHATAIGHEVDHIIPLRGKYVSGLHVPWNLQALPQPDNRRKSNIYHGAVALQRSA